MFNQGYKAVAERKVYKRLGIIKYRQTTKSFEQLNETSYNCRRHEELVNYKPFKYKGLSFNVNDFLNLNLPIDDLYVVRESFRNKKIAYYHKGV